MRSRRSSLVETQFYQHENHQFNTKSQLRAERFAPNALLLFIMVMILGVWMVNHQNAGAFCNSLLGWNVICFWSIVIAHALHPESYSTRYKVVSSHSKRDERHTHTHKQWQKQQHTTLGLQIKIPEKLSSAILFTFIFIIIEKCLYWIVQRMDAFHRREFQLHHNYEPCSRNHNTSKCFD